MIAPLNDVVIVESYSADAPVALKLAGALAGRIAADLGARVVKVAETNDARSAASDAFLDAGKEIVAESALPRALAQANVAIVDARMQAKLSTTPIIVASLSMFAPDIDEIPASEFTLMALGGLLDIVGDPEREPLKLGGRQAAYAAGLAAYAGVAAALCRTPLARDVVHVSMLDTIVWLNWKSAPTNDGDEPQRRAGAAAEWRVVRCADGWIALVYQDSDWPALCAIVDDPRLRTPDFTERAERVKRLRDVASIIEQSFITKTRAELRDLALKHRLPIGPVWSPAELRHDPHYAARDFLTPIEINGRFALTPRLPVAWSGHRFQPVPSAPPVRQAVSS